MRRSLTGRDAQSRPGFKARRGALLYVVGLLIVGLVTVSAIVIDMSRLSNLSAELQVAADAGAHAGAVQYMLTPGNTTEIVDSAIAYAQRNTAMGVVPTVDVAEMGIWDPITSTFTPGLPNPNAVHIVLSVAPQGLIMEIVGVGPPVVHASAIGSTATFPGPTIKAALVR